MSVHSALVENLFFVRWETLGSVSCAEVRAAFEVAKGRKKLFHVAVLPAEIAAFDERGCRLLAELLQDLLPACAHVALVIEGHSANAAALRRALSGVRSASGRRYGLSVVGSFERALVWAPGPLPDADKLLAAIEPDPEPALRVA